MKKLCLLSLLLALSFSVFAEYDPDYEPKQRVYDVHPGAQPERVVRLTRARFLILNFELIRRKYPRLAHYSNDVIEYVFNKDTNYISIPQASQTEVNTQIPVDWNDTTTAYRAPGAGRALIFVLHDPYSGEVVGIVSEKGPGSLNPSQRDHGNGLATLGEVLREYVVESGWREMLADLHLRYGMGRKTVGSLYVKSGGYYVRHADGSTSPGGSYGRSPHDQVFNPLHPGVFDEHTIRNLEPYFHPYGVYPNNNTQGTSDGHIFDFGHPIVRDDLWGLDPYRAFPFDVWGYDKRIHVPYDANPWHLSKYDYPWTRSHEMADAWDQGRAGRADVEAFIDSFVRPVQEKLNYPYYRLVSQRAHYEHCMRHNLFGD